MVRGCAEHHAISGPLWITLSHLSSTGVTSVSGFAETWSADGARGAKHSIMISCRPPKTSLLMSSKSGPSSDPGGWWNALNYMPLWGDSDEDESQEAKQAPSRPAAFRKGLWDSPFSLINEMVLTDRWVSAETWDMLNLLRKAASPKQACQLGMSFEDEELLVCETILPPSGGNWKWPFGKGRRHQDSEQPLERALISC